MVKCVAIQSIALQSTICTQVVLWWIYSMNQSLLPQAFNSSWWWLIHLLPNRFEAWPTLIQIQGRVSMQIDVLLFTMSLHECWQSPNKSKQSLEDGGKDFAVNPTGIINVQHLNAPVLLTYALLSTVAERNHTKHMQIDISQASRVKNPSTKHHSPFSILKFVPPPLEWCLIA